MKGVIRMKVWVLWEQLVDERIMWGVFSSRESMEKAVSRLYQKYGTEVGNIWWEEIEVDKLGGE